MSDHIDSYLKPAELSKIHSQTVEIVLAAGDAVMKFFRATYQVNEKSPDNPVTEADLAADGMLRKHLSEILPQAGWLSEETIDDFERLERPLAWIVDPIDGTKEFVMGLPEFAISVALVAAGQAILGIIYNPASSELFTCQRGCGVMLNDQPVQVSIRNFQDKITVEASRSERMRGEFEPFEQTLAISTMGSIAYKLARVATGQADATWSLGPKNEWDICAGALMVLEMGGKCHDLDGQPFSFNQENPKVNGIIATSDDVYQQILELLIPHRHTARVK